MRYLVIILPKKHSLPQNVLTFFENIFFYTVKSLYKTTFIKKNILLYIL